MDAARVFYSNLDTKEKDVLHSSIGEVLFTITKEEIMKFLELPETDNMIEEV